MKASPIPIINHPIGFRGFLEARSAPTVEYPMTMARASEMKTVSLATLLLRMASVTVTPIRRMTATHTANGARARMAAVIGPPPGAGDTRASSCVARPRSDHVGILRFRTSGVQGGATIRVGDDPPQAGGCRYCLPDDWARLGRPAARPM